MEYITLHIGLFITLCIFAFLGVILCLIAGIYIFDLITMLIDDYKRYGGKK
jgi:hypothetical protein